MSSIILTGDTSGTVAIAAPAVAGTNTMTLVAGTGTLAPKVLSTAVASTSGTSIDFTNIPSWVTRITVMFNGVSTNGTSNIQIQVGSGSVTTSGYVSQCAWGTSTVNATSGFIVAFTIGASNSFTGLITIALLGSNTYCENSTLGSPSNTVYVGGGSISLSGALDRVRITTVGGTDTFDAGSINIMYE